MQNHSKTAGLRLRSSFLLFLVIGNLIFSAVFVLSTGAHVYKQRNAAQPTANSQEEVAKEQKLVTLAQIN